MQVLYYLEPFKELGNPLFRLGTVRNHLDRETKTLQDAQVDVVLICSEAVAAAARSENLLSGIRIITVAQRELQRSFPDYFTASMAWYERSYSERAAASMRKLIRQKLGSFTPDVIVCYESNAPFLELEYPSAVLLHNTLGIVSRAPYPETSALDPFGVGKDSYLARFGQELARRTALDPGQAALLSTLKTQYQHAQLQHSPVISSHVRGGFERVVLLPLQVSRYFMFDGNCPPELVGSNQLELVEHVLARVPRNVGVYVSMHGAEAQLFSGTRLATLQRRHPNFLHSPAIQQLRWSSQHVLPHVDAVVTVSSSVGLQALFWDLPVIALGRSHLSGVASATSLTQIETVLNAGRTSRMDGLLHHLLTHYYPLTERYHHQASWFVPFLERMVTWRRSGSVGSPFSAIDDEQRVYQALRDDLRIDRYASEVRKSTRRASIPDPVGALDVDTELQRADLVSFDVFDTLITRWLHAPRGTLDLMAPAAERILTEVGIERALAESFRVLRDRAARESARAANAEGFEEYRLRDVYGRLCESLRVPEQHREATLARLIELEEQTEIDTTVPRERGLALLRRALELNKRVVLISDTYLSTDTVSRALRRNGIHQYDALYVSSEHRLLKKTGSLFGQVRKLEHNPRRWFHIGDNRLADVQVPGRLGIRTHLLTNASELYQRSPEVSAVWRPEQLADNIGQNVLHGVISRKFYDSAPSGTSEGWFEGSPYRLGYEAGGPLMLSFAVWTIERAVRDGVTDLYFLARDGYLPKLIADSLLAKRSGIRTHYLWASRRALSVPSLHSERDVIASLDLRFSPMSVHDVLQHRFGVDKAKIHPGSLEECGYSGPEQLVDVRDGTQRSQLERLLRGNLDVILESAERERTVLWAYLESEGLYDKDRRVAVVDIGHNASLQAALSRVLERPDVGGYYFATFYAAQQHYRRGLDIASYLLEFEDNITSEHTYCKNIGMFEFLFLPPFPSIVRIEATETGFEPVYVEGDESTRFALVEEVHRGVIDFCADVDVATLRQPHLFNVSKNDAIRNYSNFTMKPSKRDAEPFRGVSFVDAFGGSTKRYLVATPLLTSGDEANLREYLRASWWKAGARAAAGLGGTNRGSLGGTNAPWRRKLAKLRRTPRRFFEDMRLTREFSRLLRELGWQKTR